ncbi:hypothetical protein Bbelb_379260 [Branchiostoma belcheri]|nr:hypothetical protein Bbelb_379260 [Branchiostoma belcheri]
MAEARRTLDNVRHFLETVKCLFQKGNQTETVPSLSRPSPSATRAASGPHCGPPESAGLPQPRYSPPPPPNLSARNHNYDNPGAVYQFPSKNRQYRNATAKLNRLPVNDSQRHLRDAMTAVVARLVSQFLSVRPDNRTSPLS